MADISKIKLPSGNEYDIKDAVAREMISGGISFIISWTATDYASIMVLVLQLVHSLLAQILKQNFI